MKRHGKRAGVAGGGGLSGRPTVSVGGGRDAGPLAELVCDPTIDPSSCMS